MGLREYFEAEATDYLNALEQEARALEVESGGIDELRRPARSLAGIARLAGDDRMHRAAGAIARALRSPAGSPELAAAAAGRVLSSIPGLRVLLDRDTPDDEADELAATVVREWEQADSAGLDETAVAREPDFLSFVAREAAGIADTTERAIAAFAEQPTNREWIGAILRRQRVLLGAARLDEVPIVPEALRAVDDLAGLIVRLGVPVKSEWLDVFRTSLDVLRTSAAMLVAGETPEPTPALSRLRTLHTELTDRYGNREPATPARQVEAPLQAPAGGTAPGGSPIEQATALRARIERALGPHPDGRHALDDLWAILLNALR